MIGRLFIAALIAVAAGAGASGYSLLDDRWPDGTITMHLQLGFAGRLLDGSAGWGESAESALADWNRYAGRVQFRVVRDSTSPRGDGNGVNSVSFATDVYGMNFETNVIAITTSWSRRGTRTEADVIFNSKAGAWDSYSGPLKGGTLEFHRVALHEFGHVLGLAHPDELGQPVSAVMNSQVSNLDHLTADDIAGVQALDGLTESGSHPGTKAP
jgi:matrixin